MKIFSKDQQVIAFILGLTILFIALLRPFHPFGSMFRPSHDTLPNEPSHQWIVEVAGAVKNPGIYTLDKPPSAYQAIQSIGGGPIGECHLSFDSLGDALDTGTRVELQACDAEYAQLMITPMSHRKRLVLGIPIDLNQAGSDDLAMIPGISHGLAGRIVAFRESHGPFKMWTDLMSVKGIGPKKVKLLRSYLSL